MPPRRNNERRFQANAFGNYVFQKYKKAPPFLVWVYLQTISLTLWMVVYALLVVSTRYGWFSFLGIGPMSHDPLILLVLFLTGVLWMMVSTHMAWREHNANANAVDHAD